VHFSFNFHQKLPFHILETSFQDHKKKIWNRYRKWQEDHPISRETFALLMTGKGLQDSEDNDNDDENKENSDLEDQFDLNTEMEWNNSKRLSQQFEGKFL